MRSGDFPTMTVAFYKNLSDDSFYICEMLHVPRVGDFANIVMPDGENINGKITEVDWGLDFTKDTSNRPDSGMQVVHIYIAD